MEPAESTEERVLYLQVAAFINYSTVFEVGHVVFEKIMDARTEAIANATTKSIAFIIQKETSIKGVTQRRILVFSSYFDL